MNPAAEARAKITADHPEAVVVERRRNSIKHRLGNAPDGRQRFALDVAIGPFHYGPDNDQEIDTALVPSTAPWNWEMTKANFEVRALSRLDAGQVIEYRNGSEWVRFQPMALQYSNDLNQIQQISVPASVDATVDDDTLTWTAGYGPGLDFSWQVQTARLAKLLTINTLADLPAVDQFILDGGNPVLELNLIFAHSAGVTPYVNGQPWSKGDRDTQGLVEFRDSQGDVLWWFNLPRSWDAENNEQLGTLRFKKQGNSLYVSHRVPLSFVQGAVYPLMIDIDEQVGASGDDFLHYQDNGNHTFDSAGNNLFCGHISSTVKRMQGGMRYTTVAIGNGDTIDVANSVVTALLTRSTNTVRARIRADDADNPSAPTNDAGWDAMVDTTAEVAWDPLPAFVADATYTTPDFKAVIQELVDRGSWASGNAMIVLIGDRDNESTAGSQVRRDWHSWDGDTAKASKLHIEFTAGGVTTRRYSLPITGVG